MWRTWRTLPLHRRRGPGSRRACLGAGDDRLADGLARAAINFAGQGTFDLAAGAMKIERASIAAATVSLAAAGTLSKLTSLAGSGPLR